MQHRVPHSRRYWRLVKDLQEDGIVSESESEEDTDWDSEEETDESESDYPFDDEEDWYLENLHFGSLPQ